MVTERWKGDDLVGVDEPQDDPRIEDYRCPHDVRRLAALEAELAAATKERDELREKLARVREAGSDAIRDIEEWLQLARYQREKMDPNCGWCPNDAGMEKSFKVARYLGLAIYGGGLGAALSGGGDGKGGGE